MLHTLRFSLQNAVYFIMLPFLVHVLFQEARKFSANYRKRLDAHRNNLANALFQEQLGTRRLKRLYPADLVTNG